MHLYENWEYVTNASGLTLTSYSSNQPEPEIPGEIYGIAVTALGESLFRNNNNLQRITIPNSVSEIGRNAFQGCTSLEEVHLPSNLLRIEANTFRYCTSLKQIDLPDTLVYIGSYSFSGCTALESVVIPDSVMSVYASAFDDCLALNDVTISKNLTYMEADCFRNTPWLASQTQEYLLVGNSILLRWNGTDSIAEIPSGVTMITEAFSGNIYVESVMIPSSVTRIGQNAFLDAVNLKNVVIPDTVTNIDSNAFNGCRSLRSINLPKSIRNIGSGTFRNCEKLTQIELPARLTAINAYLLANCDALTDVVIPDSVTAINPQAFSESSQVRFRVTYDSAGEKFAKENLIPYTYYLQQNSDFVYSKNENGIQILKYIGNLFDVDIPAEIDGLPVNRINTAAFQNNQIARRITMPDTVTAIGDWAFSYMDSLESIQISGGLISLGDDALTGSGKLKEIVLPETLTEIGLEPFEAIPELRICAASDSQAKQILEGMNYEISPLDECGIQADEQAVTPEAAVIVTSVTSAAPAPTETPEPTQTPAPTETMTLPPTATATETMTFTPTATVTPTITPTMTPTATMAMLDTVYIPDGTSELTVQMLENSAYEVTLIIPASVTKISEDILNDHVLTIVSETGTEAEAFARKWDLKFLIEKWYDPAQD